MNALMDAIKKQQEAKAAPAAPPAPAIVTPTAAKPVAFAMPAPPPAITGFAMPMPAKTPIALAPQAPVAKAIPLALPKAASQIEPAGEAGGSSWDNLDLDDFAPTKSGSGAGLPSYDLPGDHQEAPDRGDVSTLAPEAQEFLSNLDSIYGVWHDAQLFSQIISSVMQELKENPAFEELIADDDARIMVKGMRESLGVARANKAAKARKVGASPAKRAKASFDDDAFNDILKASGLA